MSHRSVYQMSRTLGNAAESAASARSPIRRTLYQHLPAPAAKAATARAGRFAPAPMTAPQCLLLRRRHATAPLAEMPNSSHESRLRTLRGMPTFGAASVADQRYTQGQRIDALAPEPPAGLVLDPITYTLRGTSDASDDGLRPFLRSWRTGIIGHPQGPAPESDEDARSGASHP